VAIIIAINCIVLFIRDGSIIHFDIVLTTSPQASITQRASNITAIIIAHLIVIAFDQTAGHILLATSFDHIFIAIYNHRIAATNKYIFELPHLKKNTQAIIVKILKASISYFTFALLANHCSIIYILLNYIYYFIIYFFLVQKKRPLIGLT